MATSNLRSEKISLTQDDMYYYAQKLGLVERYKGEFSEIEPLYLRVVEMEYSSKTICLQIFCLLVLQAAGVEVTKMLGEPLVRAAEVGNIPVVKFLIKRGINPNGDGAGWPLLWAVARNQPESVRVLLEAGADPWISENDPQDMILPGHDPAIRIMLEEAKAKHN